MREAITGHSRHSEALGLRDLALYRALPGPPQRSQRRVPSSYQRTSSDSASKSKHKRSAAISRNQSQLVALSRTQSHSAAMCGNEWQSAAIRRTSTVGNQPQSVAISRNQSRSVAISRTSTVGPTNMMPAAPRARANSGDSERKPAHRGRGAVWEREPCGKGNRR
jgi:hypothetical protein